VDRTPLVSPIKKTEILHFFEKNKVQPSSHRHCTPPPPAPYSGEAGQAPCPLLTLPPPSPLLAPLPPIPLLAEPAHSQAPSHHPACRRTSLLAASPQPVAERRRTSLLATSPQLVAERRRRSFLHAALNRRNRRRTAAHVLTSWRTLLRWCPCSPEVRGSLATT
jgi:hypothetical protein